MESLEDRLTPALSYMFGAGSLYVQGSTANPTVTVTSNAAGVTVTDGASSHTFAVTANLSVSIQMTAATPTFNYDPGVDANGTVSLNVRTLTGVTLNVAGTANVNINGPLMITTGAGNDSINIDNVNPASLIVNSGAGYDTVLVGYNAPVTVRGPVIATNINLFGLGNNNLAGPPVVVQGFVHASTDFSNNINDVDIENETTIQGSVFANLVGAHETLGLAGTVLGNLFTSMSGRSNDNAVFIFDGATVVGSTTISAAGGASTTTSIGTATLGGTVSAVMGNGSNVFSIRATVLGSSISYVGGAGDNSVIYATGASAPGAHLFVKLGNGTNSFTLDSNDLASAAIVGGFGMNTFNSSVTINFPIAMSNF
jgi:hypothetical protein